MKNILSKFIVLLFLIIPVQMQAQTYEKLWDECSKAFNNDLPQTAIEKLHAIRQKAADEGNTSQLLRSLITECTVSNEISPDSLVVTRDLVEAAMEAETRPVEKALWQSAYGQLLSNFGYRYDSAEQQKYQANDLLLASVSDLELLSKTKASDYIPLFEKGEDSRFFNDDLMSVLAKVVIQSSRGYRGVSSDKAHEIESKMREIYARENNQIALLLLDYEKFNNESRSDAETGAFIERIRAILPQLKGTKVEKVFTNYVAATEKPQLHINWSDLGRGVLYPGNDYKCSISHKNVSKAELRIFSTKRIDGSYFIEGSGLSESDMNCLWKKYRGNLVQTYKLALQQGPAHVTYEDSIHISIPEIGAYILELLVDGNSVDKTVVLCSKVSPVFFKYKHDGTTHERLMFVDAKTGEPFADKITVKRLIESDVNSEHFVREYSLHSWKTLNPDASENGFYGKMTMVLPNADVAKQGIYDISDLKENNNLAVRVGQDGYFPILQLNRWYRDYSNGSHHDAGVLSRIYSDRAIYRPGQKVYFSGLIYTRDDDNYEAKENWQGTATLRDTKGKELSVVNITSDEMGSFCGEFVLPDPTIPGSFSIIISGNGVRNSLYIKVEEYKRPTFTVEIEEANPKELFGRDYFEIGDTVTLHGLVKTYSGVPIADAEVDWETKRHLNFWLRNGEEDYYDNEGETKTDAEGRFEIQVLLTTVEHEDGDVVCRSPWMNYSFVTHVEVDAPNGEMAETSYTLYAREKTPEESLTNLEKEEGKVKVENSTDGTEGRICISMPGAWVCYDIVSDAGGLLESRIERVKDSLEIKALWQENYGDGAVVFVSIMQDEVFQTHRFSVMKPKPDKRLLMEWSSFRDHLQPGQEETWSLRVKHPDGTPADAMVMARLYDASLDAFAENPWKFYLNFNRYLPKVSSETTSFYASSLDYAKSIKFYDAVPNYTHWQPSMFYYYVPMKSTFAKKALYSARNVRLYDCVEESAPMPLADSFGAGVEEVAVSAKAAGMSSNDAELYEVDASAAAEAMQMQVRENFDETAFFMPKLHTDADGVVTLNFTLPESLTQWNFTALAHDKKMNYGLLNDTIVAQKQIMTEIAAPRFLRDGDETEIPVTVRNLTESDANAELIFVVSDAATTKALKTEKRAITIAAKNAVTLYFPLKASMAALGITADQVDKSSSLSEALGNLLLRAVAKTKPASKNAETYSDGEQRELPLLSGRLAIQTTVPFSATKTGNLNVDLSALHLSELMKKDALCQPQLTLEYSANPIWNVVRVIPTLLSDEAYSATGWATRLYGIEMADYLRQQYGQKETKTNASSAASSQKRVTNFPLDETDASVSDTLAKILPDAETINAMRYTALDHLKDFQNGDGGFSWLKGFYSSCWITTDVCILLARQKKLTGCNSANAVLDKATKYLEKEVAELVQEMKKAKVEVGISELQLRYLYLRQLQGLEPDADAKYLLELASKEKKDLTMYGKSALAQVLADASNSGELSKKKSDNYLAAADLAMQSLVEHTVFTEEMGRYFDTYRAMSGWASYRIPTQTMAIEALDNKNLVQNPNGWLANQDAKQLQEEFRLWLLQSKRTQQWENSRATADATYALLNNQPYQPLTAEDYCKRELTTTETQKAIKNASYNISKRTDGLSWGAIYADYTLPASEVEQSSAGFTLERKWQVLVDKEWKDITAKNAPKVGSHVRQVFYLKADRDFDFVQLEASRAACLEPMQPLSGTTWMGGLFAYRMVRDTRNDYFFEHLAKGSYTFTEEYVVDRTGSFTTGIAHLQCTFAPEFGAYATSSVLKIQR